MGKGAVFVDEGAIPGLGCLAFRGGRAGGAVHPGQMLRTNALDEAEPLCGVAESEVFVEAAVDGFLHQGEGDGLEGDDDEGLGAAGGAFMQLGQEGILVQFDGDGSDLARPLVLEGLGQPLPPSVVLIDEPDVVETLIAGHLS